MTKHSIVIAGGGPTGLMLAGELALANVDVAIVERRATQELVGGRAGGLHARTLEVFDQRGIAQRFIAEGQVMQVTGFAMIPLDISDFPTRHNYGLALFQNHIERILAAWVAELGVTTYRERDVTGFTQDAGGVDVALSDGTTLRADYLVGCDGGRSVVRKAAGIEFAGWDASVSYLIAEGTPGVEPAWGAKKDDRGIHGIAKLDNGARLRVVSVERSVKNGEPSEDDLREALVAVWGTDFGIHDITWLSRFSDMARQATTYRAGRVFLAGDAAHVHAPTGGQGLNIGVQDAVNLGWKLARVVRGESPEALLDTYHAERHPIAARVLQATLAQIALGRGDDRTVALHQMFGELLKLDEPRKRYAGMMSGLGIHYELGAHPLVGRRMPDLELDNGRRVFSYLHRAEPVVLDFANVAPWIPTRVVTTYSGAWELPVIGAIPAPSAVLVRPDGYVAWAGTTDDGFRDALARWFSAAS